MLRNKSIIFQLLLVLCLPLVILMTSIEITAFDLEYYERKFEENNTDAETGITMQNLMYVADELIDYLKGNREDLIVYSQVNGKTQQIFEDREVQHMVDVLELFEKGFLLRNLSIVLVILSLVYIIRYNKDKLARTLIITGIIPLVLICIIGILAFIDFNKYFTYFHKIFFTNDLWLLNPQTDILIQMLPLNFFMGMAYRIGIYFLAGMAILILAGIALWRFSKRNKRIMM